MKKLTAGIFATLLAVVSAGAAHAEIASKGYVDQQVGTKADAATVTSLQGTVSDHTTQIAGKADKATTLAGYGITDGATKTELGKKADSATVTALDKAAEKIANRVTTVSDASDDTHYPTAKAVWDVVKAETSDIASTDDLTALTTRVGTLETASKTHATKTELAGKQDKLSQTGSASQPVYVNAEGKVTAGNTIPTVTTNIAAGQMGAAQAGAVATALAAKANTADLGDLATLDAVGSGQITDGAVATADIANKAVTKAKLADEIVTSLGKADTALQQTSLNGYLTKTAADAAYADIATETTASNASTNAQTALTRIGTLTDLTTGAKTNTVVAINEVASEAAAAASAASTADGKAVAAQGEVDALEAVVNNETTGLAAAHTAIDAVGGRVTTAEGEIDTIQTTISKMATSDTVTKLTERVTTAEGDIDDLEAAVNNAESGLAATNDIADSALSTAQTAQTTANAALPKATYDNQVGTVSATNMGTSASTVVAAIKEVAGEASAAQETANAAIPKPDGECADGTAKCVLTFNNSVYAWEVIARDGEGK